MVRARASPNYYVPEKNRREENSSESFLQNIELINPVGLPGNETPRKNNLVILKQAKKKWKFDRLENTEQKNVRERITVITAGDNFLSSLQRRKS